MHTWHYRYIKMPLKTLYSTWIYIKPGNCIFFIQFLCCKVAFTINYNYVRDIITVAISLVWMEVGRSVIQDTSLNTQNFSTAGLCTQGMVYPGPRTGRMIFCTMFTYAKYLKYVYTSEILMFKTFQILNIFDNITNNSFIQNKSNLKFINNKNY